MNETLKNPAHSSGESMITVETLPEVPLIIERQRGSETLTASATWTPTPIDPPPNTTIAPKMVFEPQGSEWDRMETLAPTPRPARREASGGNVAQPRDTLADIEAEQSALGSILLAYDHGEAQAEIDREGITPDLFTDEYTREIFRLINVCLTEGATPDLVNVVSRLHLINGDQRTLRDYLSMLPDKSPSFANLSTYTERLRELLARREAVEVADSIRARALDPRGSVAEAQHIAREFSDLALVRDGANAELKKRWFDGSRQPPALRVVYTLADKVIATPGNISTIAAPVKAGKSAVIGAMVAGTMCRPLHPDDAEAGMPDRDLLGFASSNPDRLPVLWIDSEQSPDDFWHCVMRSIRRAGLTARPPWLHAACLTGLGPLQAWKCVHTAMKEKGGSTGKFHSILLDGAADFVRNVNDPAECSDFVAELVGIAIERDCPLINILHFNPGTDKTRGHLGSHLERKSETNLRLDKDGDRTTIWSINQRRAPILKRDGICFRWSDEAGMHVICQSGGEVRNDAARDLLSRVAMDAFSKVASMKWTDLKNAVRWSKIYSQPLTDDGAAKAVKKMGDLQLIKKNASGLYLLSV